MRGGRGGGSDCRCDVTLIAERSYLDPKRGHPKIAMVDHHLVYLKGHLEVYCLTHASCGGKKTRSVLAQTPKSLLRYLWMLEPVTFIAPLGTGSKKQEKRSPGRSQNEVGEAQKESDDKSNTPEEYTLVRSSTPAAVRIPTSCKCGYQQFGGAKTWGKAR